MSSDDHRVLQGPQTLFLQKKLICFSVCYTSVAQKYMQGIVWYRTARGMGDGQGSSDLAVAIHFWTEYRWNGNSKFPPVFSHGSLLYENKL